MKKKLIVSGMTLVLGVAIVTIVWGEEDGEHMAEYSRVSTGVAPLSNPVYKDECGACHMVYAPGLLPAKSWGKLMSGLGDHFGEDAELDANTKKAITEFLMVNNADKSNYRRSKQFASSDKAGDIPIRITETAYFKHKHHEIPARMVTGNKQVNSFSHCNACHRRAEQASFRERDIAIPGYGKWDD